MPLCSLEQVANLHVGIAIVRIVYLAALAEERVGFIDKDGALAATLTAIVFALAE